jgi:hypothetical protein
MKGQVSVEFLILISLLLVVLTIFVFSDITMRQKLTSVRIEKEVRELCNKIAFEINSAVKAGNGYERSFYIQSNLFGVSDFSISVEPYSLFINFDTSSSVCSTVTENITGEIKKGWNLIKNIDGDIYVS